jgi:hypothetical protein
VGHEPRPTAEAQEVEWLSPEQLIDLMDEAYRARLTDALSLDAPTVRAHDGTKLIGTLDC